MKVLIVEDSPDVVETLKLCFELRWPGATVLSTNSGREAMELAETEAPDLVILDLGLPDMDGLDVLKDIRLFSDVPIVILTVRDEEVSKVKGLETGADDYIVKPFSHIELLARVKAVVRRGRTAEPTGGEKALTLGNVIIDFEGREVKQDNERVELTPTEWRLLTVLVRNAGRVLSYDTLLGRVWGQEYMGNEDYVNKYVYRLRQKLGDSSECPRIIANARGIGYKFVALH
jgi:DNA-binding response OmpR family regulator